MEQDINELKSENAKEKQFLNSKISQLEYERTEMEVREKNLQTALNQLKSDKEDFERELRTEWQNEKQATTRALEELRAKLAKAEEDIKEAERKIYLNNSEFEKQKALLEQKVNYYERSLNEMSSKEKNLSEEIKASQREHFSTLKENSQKYESLTKTLQAKVDQYQERISELEVNRMFLNEYN